LRFLDRAAVAPPACLSKHAAARAAWRDLATDPADYASLCDRLDSLQGGRCAYCDDLLSEARNKRHVDHFVQRRNEPQQTFTWSNLFRSCTQTQHCAKAKDATKTHYAQGDLLKPDVDDAHRFLRFGVDGTVYPRSGLPTTDAHKASETIRVFALDCKRLQGIRAMHLKPLRAELEEIERAGLPDADVQVLFADLLQQWKHGRFESAVRDLLGD
jgi:uncharacterized protein (TIGR02646 family)